MRCPAYYKKNIKNKRNSIKYSLEEYKGKEELKKCNGKICVQVLTGIEEGSLCSCYPVFIIRYECNECGYNAPISMPRDQYDLERYLQKIVDNMDKKEPKTWLERERELNQ